MWLKGNFKIYSLFCDYQNVQDYNGISKILLKQKKNIIFSTIILALEAKWCHLGTSLYK